MKISPRILLFLLLPLVSSFSGADDGKSPLVSFEKRDWATCKSMAEQQNKLYFVEFDASWCAVCRTMDESTFRDQLLAEHMDKFVVAHKVNVDDFLDDGYLWSQKYEVEQLPTMLVFDAKGKLVERLVGYQSGKDLLRVFQKYPTTPKVVAEGPKIPVAPNKNPTPPDAKPQPMPQNAGYTPYGTAKPAEPVVTTEAGGYKPFGSPKPSPKPAPKPSANTNMNAGNTNNPNDFRLYELSLNKGPVQGFGLQAGMFAEYDNVVSSAERLKKKVPEVSRLFVLIDNTGPKPAYRLLFGQYGTEAEATAAAAQFRAKGVSSLVKNYANPLQ